jgi:hypothetical protein
MKHKELERELLESYTSNICKENGLRPVEFSDAQLRVIRERMNEFISISKGDTTILLQFLHAWYNYRGIDYEQIPWEAISSDKKMPKELFDELNKSRNAIEKDVVEFTRLNLKMLEQQKGKEPEQER